MEHNKQQYHIFGADLTQVGSFSDAFSIPDREHLLICLVGAGGKTSTMYRMAEEYADAGKNVLITTSTHIYRPDGYPCIIAKDIDRAIQAIEKKQGKILCIAAEEIKGKLSGWEPQQMSKLKTAADVVLVEADGAKQLPFKFPDVHEPVILRGTDFVIGCVGLSALGKPLDQVCFRAEKAAAFLCETQDHMIHPQDIARVLISHEGTAKGTENMQYRILLNQADCCKKEEVTAVLHEFSKEEQRTVAVGGYKNEII